MKSAFEKTDKGPLSKNRVTAKREFRTIENWDTWDRKWNAIFEKAFQIGPFSSHETAANPNLSKIPAGLHFKPADNSTGHLFGHGFFPPFHDWERRKKGEKDASESEKE